MLKQLLNRIRSRRKPVEPVRVGDEVWWSDDPRLIDLSAVRKDAADIDSVRAWEEQAS